MSKADSHKIEDRKQGKAYGKTMSAALGGVCVFSLSMVIAFITYLTPSSNKVPGTVLIDECKLILEGLPELASEIGREKEFWPPLETECSNIDSGTVPNGQTLSPKPLSMTEMLDSTVEEINTIQLPRLDTSIDTSKAIEYVQVVSQLHSSIEVLVDDLARSTEYILRVSAAINENDAEYTQLRCEALQQVTEIVELRLESLRLHKQLHKSASAFLLTLGMRDTLDEISSLFWMSGLGLINLMLVMSFLLFAKWNVSTRRQEIEVELEDLNKQDQTSPSTIHGTLKLIEDRSYVHEKLHEKNVLWADWLLVGGIFFTTLGSVIPILVIYAFYNPSVQDSLGIFFAASSAGLICIGVGGAILRQRRLLIENAAEDKHYSRLLRNIALALRIAESSARIDELREEHAKIVKRFLSTRHNPSEYKSSSSKKAEDSNETLDALESILKQLKFGTTKPD